MAQLEARRVWDAEVSGSSPLTPTLYLRSGCVPTPFYHIFIAENVLHRKGLPPAVQQLLEAYREAFLLGCTAPDLQTVSGQKRKETHFFTLPYKDGWLPPWDLFLIKYPQLRHAWLLAPDQAAFLAGYLCHLQADWSWVLEIFLPNFEYESKWGSYKERVYYHNVLRAYVDSQVSAQLSKDLRYVLSKAAPKKWLPFAVDNVLYAWRNVLVKQFLPGSTLKTVEVFAARQKIPPQAFYQLINSEKRMDEIIFSQLPRQRLTAFQEMLIDANLRLLKYWFMAE